MMLLIKFCNEKLQEIALKPNPLTMTEHIDLMIENEKLLKKERYIERINILNEFRKDAEVKRNFENFQTVAEVELKGTVSESKQVIRPLDSKSVLKIVREWFQKHIPDFSI
jgi:ribosomal protein S8